MTDGVALEDGHARGPERDAWRVAAAYLDEALELSPADRAEWLARVASTDERLARLLASLLAEHAALVEERFLESGPARSLLDGDRSEVPSEPRRYVLGEEHARGGMGRIVRARDTYLDRVVAVKELLLSGPDAEARFLREAKMTARLEHPAIVPVHDAGRWQSSGKLFYSMKLFAGRPLSDEVARLDSFRERMGLLSNLLAVSDAIAYAHSQGVIHRDLKPANVLVGMYGETIVLDWGLAKELRQPTPEGKADAVSDSPSAPHEGRAGVTAVGAVLGTPAFMPPEQARGFAVDERADVYAIGAMIYFTVSARAPYQGQSSREVIEQVLNAPPSPLPSREPSCPDDLCAIVAKAMARSPEARYANAGELAADLRRFIAGQLVSARRYSRTSLISRWIQRHRGMALLSAGFLLLALTGAVAFGFREQRLRRSAEAARDQTIAESVRADRQTVALLEQRGRDELDRGHPFRAAVYLAEALRQNPESRQNRALVTEALGAMAMVAWRVPGSTSPVRAAFSPDETRVLTGQMGGAVRILDARSGSVLQPLLVNGGASCASFDPRGERVVTGSSTGGLELWDVHTGARLGHRDARTGAVRECAFSPDGRWILTTDNGQTARIWSADDLDQLRVLPRVIGPRDLVSFSPDSRRILVAGGGKVRVHDASNGLVSYEVDAASAPSDVAAFSPDGRFLFVAGKAGASYLYEASTGHLLRRLPRQPEGMRAVEWSADGKRILLSDNRQVRIWEVGKWVARTIFEGRGIRRASFAADGHILVLSSEGVVRLVHELGVVATVDMPATLKIQPTNATALTVSPSRSRATVTTADGTLNMLSLPRWSVLARAGEYVSRVRYSPTGRQLAWGDGAGTVSILDLASHRKRSFKAHDQPIWHLLWSPDETRLLTVPFAVSGEDFPPRLWDLASGAIIAELGVTRQYSATFSPRDDLIATGGWNQMVSFWDSRSGLPRRRALRGAGSAVAFSPDGSRLAAGGSKIRIFELASTAPTVELVGHPDTIVDTLAFDPSGRHLLSAGWDDHVAKFWDASSGKLSATLFGHGGRLMNAKFSPDGRVAATSAFDQTVRLWDPASGALLRTLQGPIHAIDFSPDGTKLTTGIDDKIVAWDVSFDERPVPAIVAEVAARSPWRLIDGRLALPEPTQSNPRAE